MRTGAPAPRSLAPIVAIVAACAGLYLVRHVLAPFLIAGLVAYSLHPAVAFLERRGIRRALAVILVYLLLAGVFAASAAVIIPEAIDQVRHFTENLPGYQEALARYLAPAERWLAERYPDQLEAIRQKALEGLRGALPGLATAAAAWLQSILTSLVGLIIAALSVVVIPVFAAYLLIDYAGLAAAAESLIPAAARPGIERRMAEIDRVLRAWLKGQLIVAALLAVIYAAGLTLLGVPMGFLIGVIGGLANLVPYLGLVVGMAPAAALAFLDSGSWSAPLGVAAVFLAGQVLEGTVIAPRIVGDGVGLPPALVILSVLVGGELFGFTGLLLAVPFTAAALVLLKDLRRAHDDSSSAAVPGRRGVLDLKRHLRRRRVSP